MNKLGVKIWLKGDTMVKKYKKNIPNILTIIRIILTPIIIILGINNQINLATIFIIIASITDLFDGMLARKWDVVSSFGAKLDQFADKVFAVSILIVLLNKSSYFIPIFVLEFIIASINLFFYFKHNVGKSLYIGKVKTVFLYMSMGLWFLANIISIDNVLRITCYLTMFLQVICIISYLIYYLDKQSK